jgi:hypothetical protein
LIVKSSKYNWNAHFKRASRPYFVDFGTIGGQHTIHELSNLFDALQSQVDSMKTQYETHHDEWQEKDFMGFPAWEHDWQTFLTRWQPVADWTKGRVTEVKAQGGKITTEGIVASAVMTLHPLAMLSLSGSTESAPWDTITDEAAYQHLLSAFKPYDGDPTSFPELDRRWRASPNAPPPPKYNVPQPDAPDADLNVYKGSDKVVKDLEKVGVSPFGPPIPLWKKIALGAAGLVGLGIVIRIGTGRIL